MMKLFSNICQVILEENGAWDFVTMFKSKSYVFLVLIAQDSNTYSGNLQMVSPFGGYTRR